MREGWKETTLGEQIRPTKGVTYASSDYCSHQDGHAFMTIKCVGKGGGFSAEGLKYYKGAYLEEQVLHAGDLVIALTDLTRAGDIVGGPVIVPNFGASATVLPSMDLAILRPTSVESNLTFLFYRLMLPDARRYMLAHAGGTTVLHLTTKAVRKFEYLAPPPSDQTKIAEILSTVDEAIEQTEALLAKTQQIKAGLMHDLFTRGVTPEGHLRPSREEAPQLYKKSPLGWIPKEWDYEHLSKLTTRIVDGVHHTPTYVEHGVPFVTVKNLTCSHSIDFLDLNYISHRDHQNFLRRADPKLGDVLVTKDGTLGVSRLVEPRHPEFSIFVSVAMLRPIAARLRPHMLQMFFDCGAFERQLSYLSAGTGLKHIHLEHFRRFVIPLPDGHEQDRIALIASSIEGKLVDEENGLEKLQRLKRGLMHDLLTGRVRVATETSAKPAPATANV